MTTSSPRVHVDLQHVGLPYLWDEAPGVEWWGAELQLGFERDGEATCRTAVVAHATIVRIDNRVCADISRELDEISGDLGSIGAAIAEKEEHLMNWSIGPLMYSSTVVAVDVVVDPFWRGRGLGPALLGFAADSLWADGVFLSPCALGTRPGRDGRCVSDYDLPRPGPEGQAKVEAAWRDAGFRPLADDVVWMPTREDEGTAARERLGRFEAEAATEAAEAWWADRVGDPAGPAS